MKIICTLLFVALSICAVSFAQPVLQKQRVAGGNQDDNFSKSAFTSDGGIIVGGRSISGISGNKTESSRGDYDYWIVKYDSAGKIQWDKTIGGSGTDNLAAVEQTSDGGYILGGTSSSDVGGDKTSPRIGVTDYWIVKLDKDHNIEWDKTFNPDNEFGYIATLGSVEQTADGGYITAGATKGDDPYSAPVYVVKLDAAGNIQWSNSLNDFATGAVVHQITDGSYIIGATAYNTFYEELSYEARKLDINGNEQWRQVYRIGQFEASDYTSYLSDILQTKDGYLLGGSSDGDAIGAKSQPNRGDFFTFDYWLLQTDSLGNETSDKTIGGSGNDFLTSMYKTKDGGIVLCGHSSSGTSFEKSQPVIGGYDYWTVKLTKNKNISWDKTDGGTADDVSPNILEKKRGVYAITGTSASGVSGDKTLPSQGGNDYWSILLNENINVKIAPGSAVPDFSVFPNPAKDVIYLKHKGIATFLILNQAGNIILKQAINGDGMLNLSAVLPGIYTIINTQTNSRLNLLIQK